MPPNVGYSETFGDDEDWEESYKVQAIYNQSHVWSHEAHEFNEIVVRKLKNMISEYEEDTHAENQRFNTKMKEVLQKLKIDLEESEPERKAKAANATQEDQEGSIRVDNVDNIEESKIDNDDYYEQNVEEVKVAEGEASQSVIEMIQTGGDNVQQIMFVQQESVADIEAEDIEEEKEE